MTRKRTAKKSSRKAKSKGTKRKSSAKKGGTKKKSKRKPNAAFMKPLQPSVALSRIVGTKKLPRTQVVKKLWKYIKAKKLQDKKNRRMINTNEQMKAVFGGKKQVSMFDMAKYLKKHLK